MSEADELNTILAEWVERAEADLASAPHLLEAKDGTLVQGSHTAQGSPPRATLKPSFDKSFRISG